MSSNPCESGAHAGVEVGADVGVGGAEVGVGVAVEVGPGVGVPPQLPLTLNTRCMFGNPMLDTSVGVVIPQSTALM